MLPFIGLTQLSEHSAGSLDYGTASADISSGVVLPQCIVEHWVGGLNCSDFAIV